MKNELIIIVLTLFSLNTYSQNKFKVDIGVSPELNYSVQKGEGLNESIQQKSRIGYGIGFGVYSNYSINSSIDLRIGLNYNFRNYKLEVSNLIFPSTIINNEEPNKIDENVQVQNVSIPLMIVYKINTNVSLLGGISIETTISDQRNRNLLNDEGKETLLSQNAEINTSPISMNFGVSKMISDKIFILPMINIGFTELEFPIVEPIAKPLINFQIGVNYKL